MGRKRTTSYGRCFLCGYSSTKGGLTRHLKKHLAERQGDTPLLWLRVTDRTPWGYGPSAAYWLDLEVPENLEVAELDDFLRAIWVECCGHLSHFAVSFKGRAILYRRNLFEDDWPSLDEVQDQLDEESRYREQIIQRLIQEEGFKEEVARRFIEEVVRDFPLEVSMYEATVGDLAQQAEQWDYEYDYGTTTYLRLKVMARYHGLAPDPKDPIRILSRNYKPDLRCRVCDAPAEYWEPDTGRPLCAQHLAEDEVEWALPIVNSPRTGVCAYTGPTRPSLAFEEVYRPPKKLP